MHEQKSYERHRGPSELRHREDVFLQSMKEVGGGLERGEFGEGATERTKHALLLCQLLIQSSSLHITCNLFFASGLIELIPDIIQ